MSIAHIDPGTHRPDALPTERHALKGGTWVKKPGGLRVWVEDEQPDWDYIIKAPDVLDVDPEPSPTHVTGVLCECGCLLRDDRELCPACVIPWCLAQEERGFWVQFERANRRGAGDALVAQARRRVA